MTNAQAEEVPFLAGMPRDPTNNSESTKLKFWIDGRLAALRGVIEGLKSARGPDPDFNPQGEDDIKTLTRAVVEMARHARRPNITNGGEESNWKTIALFVMGFLQALILAFMGWIYTTTSQTHDDVIRIKCRLDPQSCMGSPNVRP